MSELVNVRNLIEAAEAAANAGDLSGAEDLLQRSARIQEAELGPLHPDLANTQNNLAILAEKTGRLEDAERFYRRAVAIASASLPADDPMVASSRKNLEDFCRDRGLSIDAPPVTVASPERMPREPEVFVRDDSAGIAKPGSHGPAANAPEPTPPISSGTPRPVGHPSTAVADRVSPAPAHSSRTLAGIVIGLVLLSVAALFMMRSRVETPPQPQTPSAVATGPGLPPPAGPSKQSEPPRAAPPRNNKSDPASAASGSSNAITLVVSQLCRTLSTSAGNWKCEPAGNSVAPGAIAMYTRVRSARDAVVIHQWYRGDKLQKSARLTVHANTTDGYRTYSRQTVHSGEDWRVEVKTANGDLLYEQRLTVATTAR
jgi:Tetratricopeptide repeat/Protein of unknown function (DUF2914)